jgi:hypothetical protein
MVDTPEPREENRPRGPGTVRATKSGPPDCVRGRPSLTSIRVGLSLPVGLEVPITCESSGASERRKVLAS